MVFRRARERRREMRGDQIGRRTLTVEHLESRQMLSATDLTDREQLLLELVNRARANPTGEAARYGIDLNLDLDEGTITPEPKQPLAPNQDLTDAARLHSLDMLEREFFAHDNPEGLTPTDRATAQGYPGSAGENIAWYGRSRFIDRDAEVYSRHEALFLSESHRTNMLNGGWRELGNGIEYGLYEQLVSIMVTENFGTQNSEYFVTGIVYTDKVERDNFYTMGEGIGSVKITATRSRDGLTRSTTTGAAGGYGLQVPTGVYTVTAEGPGISSPFRVHDVVILAANQKVDFNTRNRSLGTIEGLVFEDLDRDGIRDAGEPPIAGQTIYLDADDSEDRSPDETSRVTDSSGVFRFTDLRPGDYILLHDSQPGWVQTVPEESSLDVSLAANQTRSGLQFGIQLENPAPVARDDEASTLRGLSVFIDVYANDSDDKAIDPAQTRIHVQPEHGVVRLDSTRAQLRYTPDDAFVGFDSFEYSVLDEDGLASNVARVEIEVIAEAARSWQHPTVVNDVNNDGHVSPIDALLVLNDLNAFGARTLPVPSSEFEPPPYLDVNGDQFVSPVDALLIFNELNARAAQEKEAAAAGEADFSDLAAAIEADRKAGR